MSSKKSTSHQSRVFSSVHRQISSIKLSLHRLTNLLRTASSLGYTNDRELKLKVIAEDIQSLRQLLNNVLPASPSETTSVMDTPLDVVGRSRSRSNSPSVGDDADRSSSQNSRRKSHLPKIPHPKLLDDDALPDAISHDLTLGHDYSRKPSVHGSPSAISSDKYSFIPLPSFIQSPYVGIFDRSSSSSSESGSDS